MTARHGWARQKSRPKQKANKHLEEVNKQLEEVGKDAVEKQLGDVEDRIYFLPKAKGPKRRLAEQKTEGLKREKRRLECKKQQLLEHNRQQLDVAASSSSSSSWAALRSSAIQKPVTK